MNISIRKHVMNNFKNESREEIKKAIIDSIEDQDEITLPGLGVFFEILWDGTNDKDKIIDILYERLKKNN